MLLPAVHIPLPPVIPMLLARLGCNYYPVATTRADRWANQKHEAGDLDLGGRLLLLLLGGLADAAKARSLRGWPQPASDGPS
ncbi:hypothetical protein PG996_007805 [Apiospora saccharicola]|uniref:Uncharacterized protein n=1 Tax=Apiospora saccharicola TaxID=335842 RepID=A0ABR1UZC8_9PEZI